jgi:hypothetical protein
MARARGVLAVALALALGLVWAAPEAAAAPPVIPQYGSTVPTAGGPEPVGGPEAGAGSTGLPAGVDARLNGESGDLLRAIGTSAALGAPASPSDAAGAEADQDSPSTLGAVTDAAFKGPALILVILLALVTALMILASRRANRATER